MSLPVSPSLDSFLSSNSSEIHLPDEVWILIVESVEDKDTLRNLSLVDRVLRSLAQARLFRTVRLQRSKERSEELIDHLCGGSQLGRHVRNLKISVYAMIPDEHVQKLSSNEVHLHVESDDGTSIAEWATQLEIRTRPLIELCRSRLKTLRLHAGNSAFKSLDSLCCEKLNDEFCLSVALNVMMSYDFANLRQLELTGRYLGYLKRFLRANVLHFLPGLAMLTSPQHPLTEEETRRVVFWTRGVYIRGEEFKEDGPSDKGLSVAELEDKRRRVWGYEPELIPMPNYFAENLRRVEHLDIAAEPGFVIGHAGYGVNDVGAVRPVGHEAISIARRIQPRTLELSCRYGKVALGRLHRVVPSGNRLVPAIFTPPGVNQRSPLLDANLPDDVADGLGIPITPSDRNPWIEHRLTSLKLTHVIVTDCLSSLFSCMSSLKTINLKRLMVDSEVDTFSAIFSVLSSHPSLSSVRMAYLRYWRKAENTPWQRCRGPKTHEESEFEGGTGPAFMVHGGYYPRHWISVRHAFCSSRSRADVDRTQTREAIAKEKETFTRLFQAVEERTRPERMERKDWVFCDHADEYEERMGNQEEDAGAEGSGI